MTSDNITLANDNRSLSSFLKPRHKAKTAAMLDDLVSFLEDEGVPAHILADCLFEAMNQQLQPPVTPDAASASSYYLQLRRFSGELRKRIEVVRKAYDMDLDDWQPPASKA